MDNKIEIKNDLLINKCFEKYLEICNRYDKKELTPREAVDEIKGLQDVIGFYVVAMFETIRREGGD